jgi:hypothetical protein
MRETEAYGVFGGREWEWAVTRELVCAWITRVELVRGAWTRLEAETRDGRWIALALGSSRYTRSRRISHD